MNLGLVGLLALCLSAGEPDLRVALSRSVAELAILGEVVLQPSAGPGRRVRDPRLTAADAPLEIQSTAGGLLRCELRATAGRIVSPRSYRGRLQIHASGKRLIVVNQLPLEDYLRGVVPLEQGAGSPPAALAAQAIACRSYALARRGDGRRAVADFDVANTQAYLGAASEKPQTDTVVAATAGQTLRVDDRPVEAVYSACCGGLPASAAEVWGASIDGLRLGFSLPAGQPWSETRLRQVLAGDVSPCRGAAGYRWRREIALDKLPGTPATCRVVKRGPSGRVLELALGQDVLRGDTIRRRLGELPSLLFALTIDRRKLILDGGGHGHGVGMCQSGAIALAKAGDSAAEILAYYYPDAELAP